MIKHGYKSYQLLKILSTSICSEVVQELSAFYYFLFGLREIATSSSVCICTVDVIHRYRGKLTDGVNCSLPQGKYEQNQTPITI